MFTHKTCVFLWGEENVGKAYCSMWAIAWLRNSCVPIYIKILSKHHFLTLLVPSSTPSESAIAPWNLHREFKPYSWLHPIEKSSSRQLFWGLYVNLRSCHQSQTRNTPCHNEHVCTSLGDNQFVQSISEIHTPFTSPKLRHHCEFWNECIHKIIQSRWQNTEDHISSVQDGWYEPLMDKNASPSQLGSSLNL